MTGSIAVWRKELIIYFATPIFYLTGFFFLLLAGYFFYLQPPLLHRAQLSGRPKPVPGQHDDPVANGLSALFSATWRSSFYLLFRYSPCVSWPKKNAPEPWNCCLPFPSPTGELSWGNFWPSLALYALLLAITVLYSLAFATVLKLDWGAIAVGYLGLFLLGGAFLALGLFCSSLTENQIIAAIIAFSLLLLFWIIGWYEELGPPGPTRDFFKYISTMGHFDAFSRGVLDTRDILYYLGFIFFFLFLTKRQLESRQWRG